MRYSNTGTTTPANQLYTNQTQPYFRAPHIYVATAARFMPGRKVVTDAQAKEIGAHPEYYNDTSDAVLMSTRGGDAVRLPVFAGVSQAGNRLAELGLADELSGFERRRRPDRRKCPCTCRATTARNRPICAAIRSAWMGSHRCGRPSRAENC